MKLFLKIIVLTQLWLCPVIRCQTLDETVESGTILDCDTPCSLPASVENGKYLVVGSEGSIESTPGALVDNGTLLLYECNLGYYSKVSSPMAICSSGQWIKRFEGCESTKSCILPAFPKDGYYKVRNSLIEPTPGSLANEFTVLTFFCDPLFRLVGYSVAVCMAGSWPASAPSCRATHQCLLPEAPENGNYSIIESNINIRAGATVEQRTALYFICNSGFDLKGSEVAICIRGSWLGGNVTCEVNNSRDNCQELKFCVLPISGNYTIVGSTDLFFRGSKVNEGTTIQFVCQDSSQIIGTQLSTCSNGKWSSEIPKCIAIAGDCSSIPSNTSGVYFIQATSISDKFEAYCEMNLEGEKWTVIQQRVDVSVNFYRNYEAYTRGFGDLTGNHWLGLEKIHWLTKYGDHELYVELEEFHGEKKFARYSTFIVDDSSSGYKLTISGFSGTAGDSITTGMKFTAFDNDQDNGEGNMAVYERGGWWYTVYGWSNLNGPLLRSPTRTCKSVYWFSLSKKCTALKRVRMLVRRKSQ